MRMSIAAAEATAVPGVDGAVGGVVGGVVAAIGAGAVAGAVVGAGGAVVGAVAAGTAAASSADLAASWCDGSFSSRMPTPASAASETPTERYIQRAGRTVTPPVLRCIVAR